MSSVRVDDADAFATCRECGVGLGASLMVMSVE